MDEDLNVVIFMPFAAHIMFDQIIASVVITSEIRRNVITSEAKIVWKFKTRRKRKVRLQLIKRNNFPCTFYN